MSFITRTATGLIFFRLPIERNQFKLVNAVIINIMGYGERLMNANQDLDVSIKKSNIITRDD